VKQKSISESLVEIGNFPIPLKTDLDKGHAPVELAKRYALPEILVWTVALDLPGQIFGLKILGEKEDRGVFSTGISPGRKNGMNDILGMVSGALIKHRGGLRDPSPGFTPGAGRGQGGAAAVHGWVRGRVA
jgi:hypothetical protein